MREQKPMPPGFDKLDEYYRVHDGTRYLALFGSLKNMPFTIGFDILSQKGGIITYVFSHNYAKMKIDSFFYLTLEKTLTLHNVKILIKSVFNKNQNHCYFNKLFKECSYRLDKT